MPSKLGWVLQEMLYNIWENVNMVGDLNFFFSSTKEISLHPIPCGSPIFEYKNPATLNTKYSIEVS